MRELREWGKAVLIEAFATSLVAWALSATWTLRPLPRALRSLAGLLMILVIEIPCRISAPILLILFHSVHIAPVHGCLPWSMTRGTVRHVVLAQLSAVNALPWYIGGLHGVGNDLDEPSVLRMVIGESRDQSPQLVIIQWHHPGAMKMPT